MSARGVAPPAQKRISRNRTKRSRRPTSTRAARATQRRSALKLQLKLKSVLGTLDEQSLVAVDSFLESNAAGGARME